jgi:hypothetical protein
LTVTHLFIHSIIKSQSMTLVHGLSDMHNSYWSSRLDYTHCSILKNDLRARLHNEKEPVRKNARSR